MTSACRRRIFAPARARFAAADFSKALLTDAEFGQTELEGPTLRGRTWKEHLLMIVQ